MEKIFLFTVLLLSIITLNSCRSYYNCTVQEEESLCETQNLEIDELRKYAIIVYSSEGEIIHHYSYRWKWNIENDTIEISSGINSALSVHLFLKKNNNACPDFLFSRNVGFNDGGVIINAETGELIEHGFSWSDFYDLEFEVQKYIEDEVLVGQVGSVKFWIDFTEDNHHINPYHYEQYLE